jgi:hypothetical protein
MDNRFFFIYWRTVSDHLFFTPLAQIHDQNTIHVTELGLVFVCYLSHDILQDTMAVFQLKDRVLEPAAEFL